MTSCVIDGPAGRRTVQLVEPPIGSGKSGTIYRIERLPGTVVKLYLGPSDGEHYKEKILAMLSAAPNLSEFSRNGKTFVQIAWPTGIAYDPQGACVGFSMPEIDLRTATSLDNAIQRKMRKRRAIPEFYGNRILLATNLAAVLAELHSLGHFVIDLKPQNLRFYPATWYMAILDTDGFSIGGRKRFYGDAVTPDFVAPESSGASASALGLQHDLFALATIIFQLLNNGVHPFQGRDNQPSLPKDQQSRIDTGLYAYGLKTDPRVSPSISSIHTSFEDDTRRLFDRAFLTSNDRPLASEWRDHLRALIDSRVLVQCTSNPDHAHFSKGCGLCDLERRLATSPAASAFPATNSRKQPRRAPTTVVPPPRRGLGQKGPAPRPIIITTAPASPFSSSSATAPASPATPTTFSTSSVTALPTGLGQIAQRVSLKTFVVAAVSLILLVLVVTLFVGRSDQVSTVAAPAPVASPVSPSVRNGSPAPIQPKSQQLPEFKGMTDLFSPSTTTGTRQNKSPARRCFTLNGKQFCED